MRAAMSSGSTTRKPATPVSIDMTIHSSAAPGSSLTRSLRSASTPMKTLHMITRAPETLAIVMTACSEMPKVSWISGATTP